MKPSRATVRLALVAAIGGAALAGCSTTRPVEVTRFHLPQPIAPGSVIVQQGGPALAAMPSALAPDSLEGEAYNRIVAGELARLGFTPAGNMAQAELVATVTVDRGTREDLAARQSGLSFGLGGGGFGGGGGGWGRRGGGTAIGGGASVTVPVGGNRGRYVTGTQLRVQIKRRSDGTVVWEGRAQTEARSTDADAAPTAAVAKLSRALFAGFPGENGQTITVK